MGQTVNLLSFDFGGSNPSPPTSVEVLIAELSASRVQKHIYAEAKPKYRICGNSSVDRALAFQAGGRGFEPRFPLKARCYSSVVEHFLGKEEVPSSNLGYSSTDLLYL